MANIKNRKFSDPAIRSHHIYVMYVYACYSISFVHFEFQWVLLATIRDSDLSSVLQESCADLDAYDDCQDYVRILLS